jgi:acetyl-CoA carboxylase carboxyl transferase subunit alpha
MRITAQDLKSFGVIDTIVNEPLGGAHRDPAAAIESLGTAIEGALASLDGQPPEQLRRGRREKFLAMGRL